MSSSPEIVLLTGLTGFIATEIALTFLDAGYIVRGSVRSLTRAEPWKQLYEPVYKDRLQLVEVPDIIKPGAFDEAVKGVDIVVHAASPLPGGNLDDVEGDYLIPAINGTLEALRAASKEPKVKKVIITSSIACVVDRTKVDVPHTEEDWNPITYEGAIAMKNNFVAYSASKKLAEEAAWKYVKEENPHYKVVTLLPSFVYGPSHQPGKPVDGTNKFPALVLGSKDVDFATTPGAPTFVDVRDVAKAHLLAAQKPEADGQRFIISSPTIFPSEYPAIFIATLGPEFADKLATPPAGFTDPKAFSLDTTKSQKVLGLVYRSHQETLGDVGKYILEASPNSKV